MFGFGKGKELQNPKAARRATGSDPYDPSKSIVRQPADEPIEQPASAPAQSAPAAPAPQPAERPLSYTGVTWDGHQTIVLYTMEEGKQPVPVETVLSAWQLLPSKHKFDVLKIDHDVYCFDLVNGSAEIRPDLVPPEGICQDILTKHDARIAEHLAKLTGKPAAIPANVKSVQDALKGLSSDDLKALFAGMSEPEIRKVLDAGHAHLREMKQKTGGSKKDPASGGDKSKPADPPKQPDPPKSQPAPQQNARRRYGKL